MNSTLTKWVPVVGLLATASLTSFAGGGVSAKASFKGTAPKAEPIKMNADPVCVKENAGKVVTKQDTLVNANGTLANVFIYVKEGVKKDGLPPAPTEAVVFDQQGCMYKPRVFGVRVNQPVEILNSDPTLHNVHAMPKTNPGFNNGMATKGLKIKKQFAKPELAIKIKCDVHGWMTATANVMDHPFFAVTGTEGEVTLKDLPPGKYTLAAWHEKLGEKTQEVTIAEGATQNVTFAF